MAKNIYDTVFEMNGASVSYFVSFIKGRETLNSTNVFSNACFQLFIAYFLISSFSLSFWSFG